MLSITKLGIEILKRFAKKHAKESGYDCYFKFLGDYNPKEVLIKDNCLITEDTQMDDDFECRDDCHMRFSVYAWTWEQGLQQESTFRTLKDIIDEFLVYMPELSHIALMERHKDCSFLWVYRYDKRKL